MWPFGRRDGGVTATEARTLPQIIIVGYGVHDRLQLTVETQRVLARYGKVHAVGLPPNLRAFLRGLRVRVVDLDSEFTTGRPFGEVYLAIVQRLLDQARSERPVVFLTQGNPMLMNSVARSLVMEGRRLGLRVEVLPGISPVDVVVSEAGIDVSVFGLQVFDAHWLVGRALPLTPAVPALIFNLTGFGLGVVPDGDRAAPQYDSLVDHLLRFYDPQQEVAMLKLGVRSGDLTYKRSALQALREESVLPDVSCLFIDAVSPATPSEPVGEPQRAEA